MKKATAINVFNELPREFDLEDLFERLIVVQKIEEAKKEVKLGKGITHEKFKKEIKKWLK